MHPTNIYEQYIEHLKSLENRGLNSEESIEKHHIIPKHASGKLGPIVRCSAKNHTLAHLYRFLVYRDRGDWVPYVMRKGQKMSPRERALLGTEKGIAELKRLGKCFFSPKWQSEQGKKGGSQKSPKQTHARSQMGLKHGRQNGILNQSFTLKKTLGNETVWLYESQNSRFYLPVQRTLWYF